MPINVSTPHEYIEKIIQSIIRVFQDDGDIKLKYKIDGMHVIAIPKNNFEFISKVTEWVIKNGRNDIAGLINEDGFDALMIGNDKGGISELFWCIEYGNHSFGFTYPLAKWIAALCKILVDEFEDLGEKKRAINLDPSDQDDEKLFELAYRVKLRMKELGEECDLELS